MVAVQGLGEVEDRSPTSLLASWLDVELQVEHLMGGDLAQQLSSLQGHRHPPDHLTHRQGPGLVVHHISNSGIRGVIPGVGAQHGNPAGGAVFLGVVPAHADHSVSEEDRQVGALHSDLHRRRLPNRQLLHGVAPIIPLASPGHSYVQPGGVRVEPQSGDPVALVAAVLIVRPVGEVENRSPTLLGALGSDSHIEFELLQALDLAQEGSTLHLHRLVHNPMHPPPLGQLLQILLVRLEVGVPGEADVEHAGVVVVLVVKPVAGLFRHLAGLGVAIGNIQLGRLGVGSVGDEHAVPLFNVGFVPTTQHGISSVVRGISVKIPAVALPLPREPRRRHSQIDVLALVLQHRQRHPVREQEQIPLFIFCSLVVGHGLIEAA
mmetsp:Transcript_29591/g.65063  ORF Transcript_29591/g.65063 Transcript_29591/m.65063 type:complete len:377 (-) Transcript_29591:440-1570(-)